MLSMSRIHDGRGIIRDGKAGQAGIRGRRRDSVLGRNGDCIATRRPRGKTYQRNGEQSPPYPPRAMVYRILSAEGRPAAEILEVEHLINWSMGRTLTD